MNYPAESPGPTSSVKYRIEMMRMRYDSPAPAKLLDGYARAGHLTCAMLHNPSKLSAYLRR